MIIRAKVYSNEQMEQQYNRSYDTVNRFFLSGQLVYARQHEKQHRNK